MHISQSPRAIVVPDVSASKELADAPALGLQEQLFHQAVIFAVAKLIATNKIAPKKKKVI